MKKLSLLLGTLGGTAAWYILKNGKLRKELGKAKNPDEVAKILGKYLGRDYQKVSAQVYDIIHSEEMRDHFENAKEFAGDTLERARDEAEGLYEKGSKSVVEGASKAKDVAKKLWGKVRG